jgi:hypothetical protein
MRGCVSPRQVPFGRSPQWLSRRTLRGREAKPKWTVTDLLLRQAQAGRARRLRRDPLPRAEVKMANGFDRAVRVLEELRPQLWS